MAEFPEAGKHCTVPECRQLDYLPIICDACSRILCKQHRTYDAHGCTEAYKKNMQFPLCPLCQQPVSIKRGEMPDLRVNEHIERDCRSDLARKKRFAPKCGMTNCLKREVGAYTWLGSRLFEMSPGPELPIRAKSFEKQEDLRTHRDFNRKSRKISTVLSLLPILVPMMCRDCGVHFCLSHRHQPDHNCSKLTPERKFAPNKKPKGVSSKSTEQLDAIFAAQLQQEEYERSSRGAYPAPNSNRQQQNGNCTIC
ncbi:AN1-type zinc finger protein 2A [Globodera pallida]|nr:AN1-type zinc finger protein 2A [Globodera pallida]